MRSSTLKALQGSIAKWEAIRAGTGHDAGPQNCPLCRKFITEDCAGCPVSKKTGLDFCKGTPYIAWVSAAPYSRTTYFREASNPQAKRAATREIKFLKSLLPSEEKK